MSLERKFELTKELGFDGIEVMVTPSSDSKSYEAIRRFSDRYQLPVLSIHAPTLLATHFVWGVNPARKLALAAEHAAATGAETVVVHPPYRWQREYGKVFFDGVREVNQTHKVHIAVENMYPWYVAGRPVRAYAVDWEHSSAADGADALTFDFSHAAVDGRDIVAEVSQLADRIQHIHLSDAADPKHDAHLVPGRGKLPLAEAFTVLREKGWHGNVVAEINSLRAISQKAQLKQAEETYRVGRALINGSA
jgi:sugar phosphate isomerase/epimerase